MTWTVVARKDFRDAARSKVLWFLSALFVLFTAGFAYLYTVLLNMGNAPISGDLTVAGLIGFLIGAVGLLIPLTGLVVGYKAVAGEVESGKAKILLSLPHTRRDVVLGKVVGRVGVLTLPIIAGFAAAALVVLGLYDSFAAVDYVVFTLLTVVFGAVFVSLAVAISSATKSTGVATASVVGVFVLFQFLWDVIPMAINYVVNGSFLLTGPAPDWHVFVNAIRPRNAYTTVVQETLLGGGSEAASSVFAGLGFAVVVLAFWIVVPVALGYLKFRAADL